MLSKDEIFAKVKTSLVEMFGIEEQKLTMDALLVDDLDLDSIDAINISVRLEKVIGEKIDPREFVNVRSLGDLVAAIEALVSAKQ